MKYAIADYMDESTERRMPDLNRNMRNTFPKLYTILHTRQENGEVYAVSGLDTHPDDLVGAVMRYGEPNSEQLSDRSIAIDSTIFYVRPVRRLRMINTLRLVHLAVMAEKIREQIKNETNFGELEAEGWLMGPGHVLGSTYFKYPETSRRDFTITAEMLQNERVVAVARNIHPNWQIVLSNTFGYALVLVINNVEDKKDWTLKVLGVRPNAQELVHYMENHAAEMVMQWLRIEYDENSQQRDGEVYIALTRDLPPLGHRLLWLVERYNLITKMMNQFAKKQSFTVKGQRMLYKIFPIQNI
ncbi:hypothetical protein HDU98_002317 [Podochytrium sp. JEL0797]|nr:hypothetical protein HDU98_002317 [Podochytrium sp. JEL0797]